MPTSSRKEIFMGIDPGLAITGYGIISKEKGGCKLITAGTITSTTKDPFGKRLDVIYRGLNKIIKKYKPSQVAIEELFFAKNVTNALKVGHARGVAYLTAWNNNCQIREFTPLQVKQAITGYGQASKEQIQKMIKLELNLKKIPKPDDMADALAIAICCAQTKEFK